MICPSPISIVDPVYQTPSKRLTVPCGQCGACRSNRRTDWSFRLKEELRFANSSYFLTLTYSDENIPISETGLPTLDKAEMQTFIKRLRKKIKKQSDVPFRYYAIGEYGTKTGRPHYHLVAYNIPHNIANSCYITDQIWYSGLSHIGTVTPASIHYVTKYHVNTDKSLQEWVDHQTGEIYNRQTEFATMSRRPGLGTNYLARATAWHQENEYNYVINNGYRQRLPRYYKDKIFDPTTRRRMAIQNIEELDKAYHVERDRLVSKGIQNVDSYILRSQYQDAKHVFNKSQLADIF